MADSKTPQKLFGAFLIISSLTAVFLLWQSELSNTPVKTLSKKERKKLSKSKLQKIWEKDIKEMLEEKLFHKEITSLKKVRVFLLDENLHKHFKSLKTPFKFNKKGRNLLEVSFMSHHSENENTDKLVIQYNLTSKQTGNMFWEHSRTIDLDESILTK